ncbi:hypothetical protein KDW20_08945 [Burkholderia cenocepacia]|nr:hypothetical protein [Burkholderia cenocepacia]MBR8075835.1 hypothetical protein [Burkholderia cenocepacia]MBR8375895.1 hypothetical protein [Burkholderia cenocepacia]MBR8410292.1 hypothetical protein [Burkholderia cenocepacia]MBR8507167.1 hypothetical protein [Burkholderia cenocepacia]
MRTVDRRAPLHFTLAPFLHTVDRAIARRAHRQHCRAPDDNLTETAT